VRYNCDPADPGLAAMANHIRTHAADHRTNWRALWVATNYLADMRTLYELDGYRDADSNAVNAVARQIVDLMQVLLADHLTGITPADWASQKYIRALYEADREDLEQLAQAAVDVGHPVDDDMVLDPEYDKLIPNTPGSPNMWGRNPVVDAAALLCVLLGMATQIERPE